jgi:type IV pilus assembly protein PilA
MSSSIRCPQCNLVNWATAENCKRCSAPIYQANNDTYSGGGYAPDPFAPPGQQFAPPPAAQFAPPAGAHFAPPAPSYAGAGYGHDQSGYGQQSYAGAFPYAIEMPVRKGAAIASLVLGLVSLPFMFLCMSGVATGIAGIITGFVALSQIKRDPRGYGGSAMARAGIITAAVAIFLGGGFVLAIVVPNLLASRRAANEGSAQSSIRTLYSAEATYAATSGKGQFGSLAELQRFQLIDDKLGSGSKNGYQFHVTVSGGTFVINATPESYGSSGYRSFYISNDGVIRGGDKHGLDAAASDPPTSNPTGGDRPSTPYGPPVETGYNAPSESSAVSGMRTLYGAEATYQATAGSGKYGTVRDLYKQGLIDESLMTGVKNGYLFKVRASDTQLEITATPKAEYIMVGAELRSFYMNSDGQIHGANKQGAEATAQDPPAY